MSIRSFITDAATKLSAQVVHKSACGCDALVVATIPYREFENDLRFFINDNEGADMNVNAAPGGTPEKIYNADDTLWTFSDIVGGGKTTPVNDERPHTGTNALKVDNSPVDDVYQFAKGSDMTMADYVSLTLWLNVDKDWKTQDGVSLYGWDTSTNTQVGTAIDLSDYFDFGDFDVYHKLTIPLTDLGSTSASTILDAFRVRQLSGEGKAPKYFLDDMQLEAAAGTPIPVKYTVKAGLGTWLHVDEFTISMADEMAGTLENGTMPYLAYDKFLGVTLVSGITYQRVNNGKVIFSANILNLMDFLQLAGTEVSAYGSDGTNSWVTLKAKHIEPLLLKSEDEDELSFTVSDDLSGLLHLRISAACKLESR